MGIEDSVKVYYDNSTNWSIEMRVLTELTDTYGDEANYSWVNRKEFEFPDNLTDVGIVRRVKAEYGMTECKFRRRDNFGDTIALWYPDGNAVVLFINIVE